MKHARAKVRRKFDLPMNTLAFAAVALMVLSAFALYYVPGERFIASDQYVSHSPIHIDGDADLLAQKTASSWPGTGSAGNPIQIRDYDIDGTATGYGIAILNTDLHIVIDGCYVHNAAQAGIYLQDLTNATVTECIASTCGSGIGLQGVSRSMVEGSQGSYCNNGFYLDGVSNSTVSNNTGDQNTCGMYVHSTCWTLFSNCTTPYNLYGLYIEDCSNLTADRCNATFNGNGIFMNGIYYMLIGNCTIADSGSQGIWVQTSSMFMVSDTNITRSGQEGIYAYSANSFALVRNNLSNNQAGAYLYYSNWFAFENNTMISNAGQGVHMDHCLGFGMRNNTITNSNRGIWAAYANSTIMSNTITMCEYGIYAQYNDGGDIESNTCTMDTIGIFIQLTNGGDVDGNNCSWCFTNGMFIDSVTQMAIHNNHCSNGSSTLYMRYSDSNQISNNICSRNDGTGISLEYCNDNTLFANTCDLNGASGIYLSGSTKNQITYSTCADNGMAGIETTSGSDGNYLSQNSATDNVKGIIVAYSRDSNVSLNTCVSNIQGGIALQESLNVTVTMNTLEHNGVWLEGTYQETWGSHRIDQSNMVNGKPVVYLVNQTSITVAENAGQVLLATCQDVKVSGKTLTDATVGLESGFSLTVRLKGSDCDSNFYGAYFYQTNDFAVANTSLDDCTEGVFATLGAFFSIENCTADSSHFGIVLDGVNMGIVKDNDLTNIEFYGIYIWTDSSVDVVRNTCSQAGLDAMLIEFSSYLNVNNNTFNNNSNGIMMSSSDNAWFADNICSYNAIGIGVVYSTDCRLERNTMVRDGILVSGGFVENWNSHDIPTTNSVNGRPVYYFKDLDGLTVPSDGGQVILANCDHASLSDANLTRTSVGLELGFCSFVTIDNVNCSKGEAGMIVVASDNWVVNRSDFIGARDRGISLDQSSSFTISHCRIAKNMVGVYAYSSSNGEIRNNLFYSNTYAGLYLGGTSTGSTIWNNTFAFNNGASSIYNSIHIQAYDEWPGNTWYVPGPVHGWGNYWSDWTTPDSNLDGIVDSPYVISGAAGASDFYPLVNPTEQLPIPEFGFALLIPLCMVVVVLVRRRTR